MFPAPINVEEIDKVFPTLIEGLQVGGNFPAVGELAVVRVDLVFHPAQVLDGFTLAWIETFDDLFALGLF